MPGFDINVQTTQNHRFRTQALHGPNTKEMVPHIKVGPNPHVGLAQRHRGHDMQDPRGQVVEFQAVILQQRVKESV
jgi:hypothetical protein